MESSGESGHRHVARWIGIAAHWQTPNEETEETYASCREHAPGVAPEPQPEPHLSGAIPQKIRRMSEPLHVK